ncbi:MAG: DUF1735 domain-containing protein [Bacteroidales bacterium]|nr:DUF1735 domain-containing protein [Bacteroidales bacterium]
MKRILTCVLILVSCLLTFSCNKENNTEGGGKKENAAELAVQVVDAQPIYEVVHHQSQAISLEVVPTPASSEAYTITLAANPALVASYNSKNGTSYKTLPSEAYAFISTSVILPRYSAKSSPCELRLKGEGCDRKETYLLPVIVESVQGGTNYTAPEDKAAYIIFKMLPAEQEGSGTQADPYLISDAASFLKIQNLLKDDATTFFQLSEDIDFSGMTFTEENPWTPINYASTDEEIAAAEKRKMVLDGDNHAIRNFKAGGALFAFLRGSIKNLVIENAEVNCTMGNVGAVLVGNAGPAANSDEVVIKNVKIRNSKLNNDYKRTGILAAWFMDGIVEDVEITDCTVTSGEQQAGGMIGRMENGSLLNCSVSGSVTSDGYYEGGMVAYAEHATIRNCHAGVKVTNNMSTYSRAGGLVGEFHGGSIEKCYATGDVEGLGHYIGGLVAVLSTIKDANGQYIPTTADISRCYASGNLTLPNTSDARKSGEGGLIGVVELAAVSANVSNSYATGKLVGFRWSSGFVGRNVGKLVIQNGYTTCNLTGLSRQDVSGTVLGGDAGSSVTCTGFIAWDVSELPFCYPLDLVPLSGNYFGTEGTVSSQARALGWSSDIWDLSKDYPTLK